MSSDRPENSTDSLEDARQDAAIRDSLAKAGNKPSAAHDLAILAAAHAFTEGDEHRTDAAPAQQPSPTSANRSRWPIAIAAAAVLAIGLMLLPAPATDQRPDRPRAANADIQPAAGAVLSKAPASFGWPGTGAAGVSYRLVIRDSAGLLLHQGNWQSLNGASVDQALEDLLNVSGDYFWVVEQQGQATPALGPYRFRISGSRHSE